jgi:hypothetical protein
VTPTGPDARPRDRGAEGDQLPEAVPSEVIRPVPEVPTGSSSADCPTGGGVENEHPGEASAGAPGEPTPGLRCRIDPGEFLVDWDTEAIADPDDAGPDARLRKPPRSDFLRAHPNFKIGTYLIDLSDSHGMDAVYVLSRKVADVLLDEDEAVQAADIFLLAAREGGYVFWPVKYGNPTEPRRPSAYVRTALAAVQAARERWVKIRWRGRGQDAGYRFRNARAKIAEPVWPPDPLALFREAVADHYIDDVNDPVIRRLLGED